MPASAVWLNGRILPSARGSVSLADRGLLYGDGILETIRVYRRHPFMLARHLARLKRSGRALGIPVRGDVAFWRRAVARLLDANAMTDAVVRLTITRGLASGLRPPRQPKATMFLQARPVDAALARAQMRGVSVVVVPFGRGPAFLAEHKTLAYLPAVLAHREASRRRSFDGLYSTPDGFVTEATTANLFVWHGNRLKTPGTGILPGIARSLVLELAREAGCPVDIRPISRTVLAGASEVFLTSSVVEVLPVCRVDNRPVAGGAPGPVTRALQRAYATRVIRACRQKT
jgi:branched-subunit amino acid aminotransferase/4-amino-4-deoxychorismate lyase